MSVNTVYSSVYVREIAYWSLGSDSIFHRLAVMSVSLMFAFG